MPRSAESELLEEAMRLVDVRKRFVDMRLRLRVWERDDAATPRGQPTSIVSRVHGGWWDRFTGSYVDEADADDAHVAMGVEFAPGPCLEVSVHRRQFEALTKRRKGLARRLVIAGPGTGKTEYLALTALLLILRRPHLSSGVVGATQERFLTVWHSVLKIVPSAWIASTKQGTGGHWLHFANGHRLEFVSGKMPTKKTGTAIQGRTWCGAVIDETQNVDEDAQRDVDERGRQAGVAYCVTEVATNHGGGDWEIRKEWYKSRPDAHEIIRWHPFDNVFVALSYWERLASRSSDHTFRRRIFAEDIPPERLVYGAFDYAKNLRPAPSAASDITRRLTAVRYAMYTEARRGRGWAWICGTDWGRLTTTTIWIKAFAEEGTGRTVWWAMHETTSGAGITAEDHARKLLGEPWAAPDDMIIIADPGINTKDADKSDYELARRTGLLVRPAHHEPVRVIHRTNMLQTMFADAAGVRTLFLDVDETGAPRCKRLVGALLSMTYEANGDPEGGRKDLTDQTHWPAALAYGVFPWEQIRGTMSLDHIERPPRWE